MKVIHAGRSIPHEHAGTPKRLDAMPRDVAVRGEDGEWNLQQALLAIGIDNGELIWFER